jgi:acyl-CoA thioesterase-2
VVAAAQTVDDERAIHSMHGYFLRPGSLDDPLTYEVDILRDGRSFTSRQVTGSQNSQQIFSMLASFQSPATGVEHQPSMPDNVPPPETLPTLAEVLDGRPGDLYEWWATGRPLDIRYVGDPVYVQPSREAVNRQLIWFKTLEPLPDDPVLHRATMAFASDYTMFDPIYRMHGLTHDDTKLRGATLDHSMWWHHSGRADEWILLELSSPAASGARGLTFAHMYSQEGLLLASVAQQLMIRLPRSGGPSQS